MVGAIFYFFFWFLVLSTQKERVRIAADRRTEDKKSYSFLLFSKVSKFKHKIILK